jgi:hypothetical protein
MGSTELLARLPLRGAFRRSTAARTFPIQERRCFRLRLADNQVLVKADTRQPLTFAGVLGILLGYRVLNKFFPQSTERTLG